jgi:hypothetical protein
MKMTVYVRNWRPNQLIFKHAGIKITLNRRGTRDDNVALPDEALSNTDVARFLRNGKLEQISEEAFQNLASRSEDETMPAISKKKIERLVISKEPPKDSPLTSYPFVAQELEARQVRSPELEWETPPEPSQPEFKKAVNESEPQTNDPFGLVNTKKKSGSKKKTNSEE